MRKARRITLWAAVIALSAPLCFRLLSLTVPIPELTPRWTGDQLQVSAPKLHFLTGNSLERLHNGAAVPFDFQLILSAGSPASTVHRSFERFVVSWDLWQERFSVVRMSNLRRSGESLTASAAEAWCLDNLSISGSVIPAGKNLWMKLEIRSAESKPPGAAPEEGSISLAALVELFSRPARGPQDKWLLETGPFLISDLRR